MATNPPPPPPGGNQPPTFGTPSYGAPPPEGPPSFGAPPGGSLAGAPLPAKKKGFNWGLTCLILVIVLCCCCCGGPMAGLFWAARTGGEFARNFRGTPLEDIMDGIEDEMRRAMQESDPAAYEELFGDEDPWADTSTPYTTPYTSGEDSSGDTSMDSSGTDFDSGTYTAGVDDLMKLGTWQYEQTQAGKTVDIESGYRSSDNTVTITYVLRDGGTETRYEFRLDESQNPIPDNDDARRLARELGLGGG